jgi:hypothetical protein
MQDFLLTLVIIFVLFRIFGRNSSTPKSNFHFTQNNFTSSEKKPDGKVKVDFIPENKSGKSTPSDSGDYVDYEEVR